MTAPYYSDEHVVLHHGDCLDVLRELPDNSVDALVTDPPAGIAFMGKAWDTDHGGRDQFVGWLTLRLAECARIMKPGGHAFVWAMPRTSGWTQRAIEDAGLVPRDCVVHLFGTGFPKSLNLPGGLGTALKPASEHWWLARKPLAGTVADNVMAYGTGALNIDGCRLGTSKDVPASPSYTYGRNGIYGGSVQADATVSGMNPNVGRWPANVVLDEFSAAALDEQSGERPGASSNSDSGADSRNVYSKGWTGLEKALGYADTGGASRFFYTAKAATDERITHDGISHPTVKPLSLMRWLVRLVTPPGGVCLEPFAGSGTTVEACLLEGFRCIAVEREADYLPLITQRINRRRDPIAYITAAGEDLGLFGSDDAA